MTFAARHLVANWASQPMRGPTPRLETQYLATPAEPMWFSPTYKPDRGKRDLSCTRDDRRR